MGDVLPFCLGFVQEVYFNLAGRAVVAKANGKKQRLGLPVSLRKHPGGVTTGSNVRTLGILLNKWTTRCPCVPTYGGRIRTTTTHVTTKTRMIARE